MSYEYVTEIEMDEIRMAQDGVNIELFYEEMIDSLKKDADINIITMNKFTAEDNVTDLHIQDLLECTKGFMQYVKLWVCSDNTKGYWRSENMIEMVRRMGDRCCYG